MTAPEFIVLPEGDNVGPVVGGVAVGTMATETVIGG